MAKKFYRTFALIALLCLLLFEYYSMSNLADLGDSSIRSVAKLVIELIALFLVANNKIDTNTRFWVLWMLWSIFAPFLSSPTDNGISFIVYNWFPQAAFLVGYYSNNRIPNTKKYLKIAIIPLLLVAIFFIFNNPLNYMLQDGEKSVDNMVFYIVCLVPFIMLIDKDEYKGILLLICVIMAVNSLKRNAILMTLLFLLIFIFSVLRKKRGMRFRNMIIITILFLVGYNYIMDHMSLSLDRIFLRFESLQDDGGSGRDVIWKHCFDAISKNDLDDWIIGHGCGSTMAVVRHTSAHNDFLTLLIEQGLVGSLFYLVFIWRLFNTSWNIFRKKGYGVTSLSCICVIVLFMGMFSNLVPLATYFAYITFAYGIILSENKRIVNQCRIRKYDKYSLSWEAVSAGAGEDGGGRQPWEDGNVEPQL